MSSRKGNTQVYFVQPVGGGAIKIGISGDPLGRVSSMSSDSPHELNGSEEQEWRLHYRFRAMPPVAVIAALILLGLFGGSPR